VAINTVIKKYHSLKIITFIIILLISLKFFAIIQNEDSEKVVDVNKAQVILKKDKIVAVEPVIKKSLLVNNNIEEKVKFISNSELKIENEPLPDCEAEYIYQENPNLTPVNYNSEALLAPTDDYGQNYIEKIAFICDSPTYWMWPYGLLGGGRDTNQIWTGPGGTMTLAYQSTYNILDPYDNIERPIRDVVEIHKPEYIILAVGINGISFMDEEYFTAEYTSLIEDIQRVSPRTIIILQSIYPITRNYKYFGSITNVMITKANSWMLKIAEDTGNKYLDTISVLLNDEGNMKKELIQKDGLHPNKDGLKVIVKYIRTHTYIPEYVTLKKAISKVDCSNYSCRTLEEVK